MTRTRLLPILFVAVAAPIAACSSNGGSSSTTTAAANASSTTASTVASSSAGSTGGGATGARTLDCQAYADVMPEVFAQPVNSVEDLGSSCTMKLGNGDTIEVLWNQYANNAASFEMISEDLEAVEVTGADDAMGAFDDMGVQVKVYVDGEGAYEMHLTPDYVSAREATQADLDAMVALAAAILRES